MAEQGQVSNKRILLFLDGTWDDAYDSTTRNKTTSIWRLSRAVHKNDEGILNVIYNTAVRGAERSFAPAVHLQADENGVGTGRTVTGIKDMNSEASSSVWDGAFGIGVSARVVQAYQFVASNYQPGDQIFCFGFSRGAYTARMVAALICDLGILDSIEIEQFPRLFDLYQRRGTDAAARAEIGKWEERATARLGGLKQKHLVKLVAVFETVGSLGIPAGFLTTKTTTDYLGFLDTDLSSRIENAVHIMGLNENRYDFRPTKWTKSATSPPDDRVKQIWVAGNHGDVGGGNVEADLTDIALLLMIEQVQACTDIRFNFEYLFTPGVMTRARIADGKGGRAWGTWPPHDSITQTGLVYTLAKSWTRVVQLTPGPNEYAEVVHESLNPQDVSTWPETLQQAARHEPKLVLQGNEIRLRDEWNAVELVDPATAPLTAWEPHLRAAINRVVHLGDSPNVRG